MYMQMDLPSISDYGLSFEAYATSILLLHGYILNPDGADDPSQVKAGSSWIMHVGQSTEN
jgi:hypothetical protein